jgi:hypothetical protein
MGKELKGDSDVKEGVDLHVVDRCVEYNTPFRV